MDDVTISPDVSCRNLAWLFDVCRAENIDAERVTRGLDHPLSELRDPSRFIDWRNYANFISNLSKYLSDDDLFRAGKESWRHSDFRLLSYVGRLLFSVRDQYLAVYGPMGEFTRSFPVDMAISQTGVGQLKISLSMSSGCSRCHPFHTLIAGQMTSLPESLGYRPAEVSMSTSDQGAVFDISYEHRGGLLAPVRKGLTWLFTARQTARELTATYDALLGKYQELREKAEKLRVAEQRLQKSEERYRLLAENVNDIIWVTDLDLEVQYISPAIATITGYTEEEVMAMEVSDLMEPESLTRATEMIRQNLVEGDELDRPTTVELVLRHKQGHRIWLEVKARFLLDESGTPINLIGVGRDISDRKLVEGVLSEAEDRYQVITNTAQDAILTIDQRNRIFFANPACESVFGYSHDELHGMDMTLLMPEALGDLRLRDLYRRDSPDASSGVSVRGLRKDRTLIPLELSYTTHSIGDNTYRTCFARDISYRTRIDQERKQLEQQLHASQKMESIGQLTGGIAHDFNNLLVAILGYADLAIAGSSENVELLDYLAEIKLAGERAADMTQKLLAFSRRQIIEPKLLDVQDLVDGIDLMVSRLLPENIEVRIHRPNLGVLSAMADSGQMEQVLINLAVNARDAMPDGGQLGFSTGIKDVDQAFTVNRPFAKPGRYAFIRVQDTGTGMSSEVQKRIFEPFFTTKAEGDGTGLGMAVVFGIVKQHEGFIDISSKLGAGTTFTIYLPLSEEETEFLGRGQVFTAAGGHETICIVEDNVQVRNLARLILRGAGYEVVEAIDGCDAVEKFTLLHEKIDLVVLDVVMPRMGGKEVMQRMMAINPDVKILFTSGYSDSGIHTNFILESGLEFIPKPYSTETLRAKVRSVLDAKAFEANVEAG